MAEITETNELQFLIGSPTKGAFTFPATPRFGRVTGMYGDLFYNNIQLSPNAIDVGNLTTNQVRTVRLFNAYLEPRVLSQISVTDGDGIVISGPSQPTTILPLESVEFTFTITLDGPPTIDAEYVFDFGNPDDNQTLNIIGSRIVAFPFYFNTGMTETFQWNTSILTSNNGTEQRAKILSLPRASLDVTAVMQIQDRIIADNLLFGWRTREWATPMWSEATALSTTLPQNTQQINIDTRFTSYRVNGLVIVWQNTEKFDVFIVTQVTDTLIGLDRPLEEDYTNPVIAPITLARMSSTPVRSTNGYNGFIGAQFESRDNQDIQDTENTPTQYRGEDVVEMEALLVNGFVEDQYNARVDTIDFNTGPLETYTPWRYVKTSRAFRVILEGRQEIWEFKQWLHRRSGRWRPFYMQTYEQNYEIVDTGIITGTLTVENDAQATQGNAKSNIAAVLKNGTIVYAGIINKQINEEGQVVIGLDASINARKEEIDYIANLGLKRLDSDRITIAHLGNNVAECIIPIIEIEP